MYEWTREKTNDGRVSEGTTGINSDRHNSGTNNDMERRGDGSQRPPVGGNGKGARNGGDMTTGTVTRCGKGSVAWS